MKCNLHCIQRIVGKLFPPTVYCSLTLLKTAIIKLEAFFVLLY